MKLERFWGGVLLLIAPGVCAAAAGPLPPPAANGPDAAFAPSNGTVPGTTEPTPLMYELDSIGVGNSLEDLDIRLFGHVEGSYTYNFVHPEGHLNLGRIFDLRDNRATFNQLDFNIERPVDLAAHEFNVGGRVELLYGGDSRFIHSHGLLDYQDFFRGPEVQFDLPQAYLDVALPLGNGLRIRAGKFLFFKQIDPNASVFYSHSFSFGAALPYTLTGVTAYYPLSDQWSVEGGISRGWDQSVNDNNGAIDGLARLRYDVSGKTSLSLAAIAGPELTHDNSHWREAVDFTVSQQVGDQLTLLLDGVFGTQARPGGAGDANWYGVSGYAVYRINPFVSLAGRVEWYRDEEGFTTATRQNLYEATIGFTLTPFANDTIGRNFKLRPEIRYDYSSNHFFDGLTRHDQYTAAIDAIFNF